MQGSSRWEKLEEAFAGAADLMPAQRASYLDAVCADDAELRAEVESMLLADGVIANSTQQPLAQVIASAVNDQDSLVGTFLGPYRVESLIGRGGMGAVYRAVREDDQYRKEVAIKVIPRLLAGPQAIARFRAERQILANLEHPNIARLLDGGTSQGAPYLVMELIEGAVPITQYVQERNLSVPERVQLMRTVCAAVQAAHNQFIVHRDLKPGNILVSIDGVVKLLDFGIAKMLSADPAAKTVAATQMMTPDFASPEQIRGEPVTTSSDVYSLGVVLYEILTGERPYRVSGQSPSEWERLVCRTEPRRPSEAPEQPPKLRKQLTGDLDNIVLMALRKDPARRYSSAERLSEDLRKHLAGLPVEARPDTFGYRASKFVGRNRWAIAAGVVIAASMVAGTVISMREAQIARRRFDQLRGFSRTILVDLHGQLADIPGTAPARQALTAHVSDYLKKIIADDASDDEELASEVATTYLRLSEFQGSTPQGVASLEAGSRLLEAKRHRGKASTEDLLTLARLRLRLGNTLGDLGRPPEARENLVAAADLARLAGPAGGLEAAKIQARADWRLARIYRVQYKLDDAERHASAAIAVCAKQTADREIEEIRNGARLVLAGVLRRKGNWDRSLATYLEVLADNERRVAENPSSVQLQRELARTHSLIADMFSMAPGHESDVRGHARRAIAIAEHLAALDPNDKTAQSELAQYLSLAGETFTAEGDGAEVEGYLRRALPIFRGLLEREPESGTYLLYTGLTEAELGDAMGRVRPTRESLQRIRAGVEILRKLADRDPKDTTTRIEQLKVQRMLAVNLARAGEAKEALQVAASTLEWAKRVSGVQGSQTELPMRELPRAYLLMALVQNFNGNRSEALRWARMSVAEWDALRERGYALRDAAVDIDKARVTAASFAAR